VDGGGIETRTFQFQGDSNNDSAN